VDILVDNVRPEGRGGSSCTSPHGVTYQKIKVKFNLEQAMKAQRWSRGIALFFL
jgi:hypothetical protein